VDSRCDGVHINMIRDQGLRQCRPLGDDAWGDDALAQLRRRWPEPPLRVREGKPLERAHTSLPGHLAPGGPIDDPLAVTALAMGRKARPLVKGTTRVHQRPSGAEG